MGIAYQNLDDDTRAFMLDEAKMGGHYISPRLSPAGQAGWTSLFEEAVRSHDDDWLAAQIIEKRLMNDEEEYVRSGVTRMRKVNIPHSAQMLAEGEFNRYYIRGLCMRAKRDSIVELEIYRGKEVRTPRPESEAKIGTMVAVGDLLAALRSNDFVTVEESAFGVPSGPNSGLTAKIP